MRRAPALLAALSLAATGCSFSSVDPKSTVHISGRALDAGGKPLADTQVLLFKQADIGEVVFGTALVLGSLSTICLLPDAPAICEKAHRATTDTDGRYRFTLKGDDTHGTLGTEATLNVVFSAKKGPSTTVSFHAKDTNVDVPDARLADLHARVTRPGGDIRLSWTPLPRAAGRKATYSAQLFDGRQAAIWSEAASDGRATVDQRILEDRSGSVAVGATTELSGGRNTGTVHGHYLSPRLGVRGSAGAPPSRGKRCAPVTGTAPAADGTFSRCAATDGDLDRPGHLSSGAGKVTTGVVVDLGSERRVNLVVARGYGGQLLLEVSSDGRSYRTVATALGTAVVMKPQGSPTARYVRLRSPAGLDESLGAEISIW